MKWKATLRSEQINFAAYLTAMKASLGDTISQAAAHWLLTAQESIPVWSGASRGTLLKLAAEVSFAIDIAPVTNSRIGLGQGSSEGSVTIDPANGQFYFSYQTDLPHLVVNEQANANQFGFHLKNPGPYEFRAKAMQAVVPILASASMPNVFDSMTVKTIKV